MFAISACGGGGGGDSDTHDRLSYVCEQSTNRDSDYCGCVADALIQAGYDTEDEISQLGALASEASRTGSVNGLPAPVVTALDSCDSSAS